MKNVAKTLFFIRNWLNLNGKKGVYFYAVLSGIFAAFIALGFQKASHFILSVFTSSDGKSVVESFSQAEPWQRITSLVAGGIIAGIILLFAAKKVKKRPTPYMEAVSIGNGYIPVKANLLRSLAAIVTIGSGASIGREGPLVQTVAVFASMFGRRTNLSTTRLRLLIACSAAGAMSAVFHTPLAGGLFVCEIVIGVMSIDILAPLLVSSCTSYLVLAAIGSSAPLYENSYAHVNVDFEIVFYTILLGILASLMARVWLSMLAHARKLLNRNINFLPIRLAIAGAIVGTISIWFPEVTGNGAHIIRGIVSMNFALDEISAILVLKILSVALFFGMGAVGGVLTPSLTIGGVFGFFFAHMLVYLGVPLSENEIIGFSVIGMAAFFTTAAAAPLTSMMLVIEFTMAGQLIFPLIVAVLVSHGVAIMMRTKSMYAQSAEGGMRGAFGKPLKNIRIKDIFRKTEDTVSVTETFDGVAKIFLKNPEYAVYVVSRSNKYIGGILRSDILSFIKSKTLSSNVIAEDIMRADIPVLRTDMPLIDGVKIFAENSQYESMPIVNSENEFYGIVNRNDIFMGFNEILKRDKLDRE